MTTPPPLTLEQVANVAERIVAHGTRGATMATVQETWALAVTVKALVAAFGGLQPAADAIEASGILAPDEDPS